MAYSGPASQLKSYAESVASILRTSAYGYSVVITWDAPATSGPFLTNLTGAIRATKSDPKVGAITQGQGLTYDVMNLYAAAGLARKIDTLWKVRAINAGSKTVTTVTPPKVVSSGVTGTTVNKVDTDTQAGTIVKGIPVQDGSGDIVTGTLEAQIKAVAAPNTVLNWDQWNWYAEKVTKTPGAAPENYKLTRDASGQVYVNGVNKLPFETWWAYVHAHYGVTTQADSGGTGGTGTGTGTGTIDVGILNQILDLIAALLLSGAKK